MQDFNQLDDDVRDEYFMSFVDELDTVPLPPIIKRIDADTHIPELILVKFNDGVTAYASPNWEYHSSTPVTVNGRDGSPVDEDVIDFSLTGEDAARDAEQYVKAIARWYAAYRRKPRGPAADASRRSKKK